MRRSIVLLAIVGMLIAALAIPALARGKGRGTGPTVYVTSQGLNYDTIVLNELPWNGQDNWQQLFTDGGLSTEYGPGDKGYFGGRWFIDMDGNNKPSDGDQFFLCPLLGPGF